MPLALRKFFRSSRCATNRVSEMGLTGRDGRTAEPPAQTKGVHRTAASERVFPGCRARRTRGTIALDAGSERIYFLGRRNRDVRPCRPGNVNPARPETEQR